MIGYITDRFLVILTRFSRVTFNAAHKYLGLTQEVLRTEKAINDLAYHPLPDSFYEGGGLQYLRHKFDGASSATSESGSDYMNASQASSRSTIVSPLNQPRDSSTISLGKIDDTPLPLRPKSTSRRSSKSTSISSGFTQSPTFKSPRQFVQAGDLLVPKASSSDVFRPLSRTFSVLNTPRLPSEDIDYSKKMNARSTHFSSEDFDLREEVMSCIAKSIGLLQPPLSGSDSIEGSPGSPPTDPRRASAATSSFNSPFGSLSLLDIADDLSSMTGGSSVASSGNYLHGLDNEVEILFYPAGTTLVKAGEANTGTYSFSMAVYAFSSYVPGLFYVIDGFLDILLPLEKPDSKPGSHAEPSPPSEFPRSDASAQKLLFTVKPGGIAGYLCKGVAQSSMIFANTAQRPCAIPSHTRTSKPKRTRMSGSCHRTLWNAYLRSGQLCCSRWLNV